MQPRRTATLVRGRRVRTPTFPDGRLGQTGAVAGETEVNLRLDSESLYEALRAEVGDWRLAEHEFRPEADELRISYDIGGTGRVSLTVGFELDRDQMDRLLRTAHPAG